MGELGVQRGRVDRDRSLGVCGRHRVRDAIAVTVSVRALVRAWTMWCGLHFVEPAEYLVRLLGGYRHLQEDLQMRALCRVVPPRPIQERDEVVGERQRPLRLDLHSKRGCRW